MASSAGALNTLAVLDKELGLMAATDKYLAALAQNLIRVEHMTTVWAPVLIKSKQA